jgi:8-oxo-dGTP pyrophosphatase MutT (NUDIX family)
MGLHRSINDPSVKLLRASRPPKELPKELSKERQQVAAVCYRLGRRCIEFLLVQTRGGRWIFPKGGVESGLTQAQSAALEAIEEAGVHGRMEEIPFTRYFRRKREILGTKKNTRPTARSSAAASARSSVRSSVRMSEPELAVAAHLCEVTRLEPPQEADRNPTWFSAERAKQRLEKDRAPEFGAELTRVIDRALARIQRLHASERTVPDRIRRDGLQEVRFEAFECGNLPGDLREAVLSRYFLRRRNARSAAAQTHLRKIQQIAVSEEIRRPILRLGTGAGSPADAADNITAIDGGRRAVPSKPGKPPASKRKVPGRFVGGHKQRN